MNRLLSIGSWLKAGLLVPILVSIGTFSVEAIPLTIDADKSQVTYVPPPSLACVININLESSFVLPACPPSPGPEVLKVSGVIELGVIPDQIDLGPAHGSVTRMLLKLTSDKLVTAASSKGFLLGQAFVFDLGLLSGTSFETSDSPCFLFVGPGSCSGFVRGVRTSSTGIWDGQSLTWNGTQLGAFLPFDGASFTFSVFASSSSVPVPSTSLLLVSTLVLAQFRSANRKFKPSSNSKV
jgi:hypothetical protein